MTTGQKLRVGIYARVSSDQQAEADTIASQVAALEAKVRQDGFDLDQEFRFVDNGYSGSTLLRPGLERLRDVAASGTLDRLYVHSPDRLSRSYVHQMVLVEELQHSGVEVCFLNYTPGKTPEDHLLLQVQGMVAEYERAKILERSRRGKLHAARRGLVSVLGQAAYGYQYIPVTQGSGTAEMRVSLQEAGVVRQIFEWIGKDRLTIREVCRRLRTQGVRSPSGRETWSNETIAHMLRNPVYKGTAAFGKTRAGERRPQLRPRRNSQEQPRYACSLYRVPPEEWILIPVSPIVSEELFAAAQEQLAENRRVAVQRQRGPTFLLQGLVVCKQCGYAFCGRRTGGARDRQGKDLYSYYRCWGRDACRFNGVPRCKSETFRTDVLDQAVWDDVCALLEDPARLQDEFERRLRGSGGKGSAAMEQTRLLVRKLERSVARLIDAYADGLLEKSEFEPRISNLRARLERSRAELKAEEEEENHKRNLELVLTRLEDFASKVRDRLKDADWPTRREVIRSLVKRVEIGDQEVQIVYRVDPGPFPERPSPRRLQLCAGRGRAEARSEIGESRWGGLRRSLVRTGARPGCTFSRGILGFSRSGARGGLFASG